MAKFISGNNRNQLVLFPEKLDDLVGEDEEVRIIDQFVETLDLREMNFKRVVPNNKGTNSYNPKDLLKLYLYGYRNKVRSSRELERLCKKDIDVKWLLKGLEPDFRTISDFRKENINAMKEVFKQTVVMGKELKLIGNQFSQDGFKVQAVNSKERNYTLNKLDDRIKREKKKLLDEATKRLTELSEKKEMNKKELEKKEKELEEKLEKYMKAIDKEDKKEEEEQKGELEIEFTKDMVELSERLKKHKKMRKEIEESGERQKSLTDKDARLMKNNEKYEVAYNVQEVTDTKSHLVMDYKADNNPADSGTLEEMSESAKKITGKELIDNITDKGYLDREDMAKCLEKGIRPQVTLPENEEYFEVEFEYVENEISEKEKKSRRETKIKKCLEAGVIPEVYKRILSDIKVVEKKEVVTIEEIGEIEEEEIDEEDLRSLGMKEKCFVKDKKHDKVFCPQGEVLRPKSRHRNKRKYYNKLACQRCKNPCTKSKFKELLMGPDQIVSTVGNKKGSNEFRKKYNKEHQKRVVIKKVVKAKLIPEKRKLKKRMRTSEHVHGTLKRTDNASYLLLKGKEKVNGELALSYCATNLRRLINLVTYDKLIEYLNNKLAQKGAY